LKYGGVDSEAGAEVDKDGGVGVETEVMTVDVGGVSAWT
jgi:hypothetical protein